jgi:hypothetical protein
VFLILQQTLSSYNVWYLIVLGLVAIVVVLVARRGLWGLADDYLHVRLFPVGYWLWTPSALAARKRGPLGDGQNRDGQHRGGQHRGGQHPGRRNRGRRSRGGSGSG